MSEGDVVWGVWETFFDTNELVDLYWSREAAEARAAAGGVIGGVDYGDTPRLHIERHAIRGERSE